MMAAGDTTAASAATYACAGALVDALVRAGVRHACICPGSRSTPLALCLAEHAALSRWVHVDERSAAFFALGLAKASGTPVALVCTSGTAAANFLPAIVEARYGRVPLLVLTADRPPELRDNGAPQAIDQIHLYGSNVKWFVEMPLPDAAEPTLRYVRATAARAAATAMEGPAGPVHLNLPFREPLVPPSPDFWHRGDTGAWSEDTAKPSCSPYLRSDHHVVVAGPRVAPRETVADLARSLAATPRGLIVCGPQSDPALVAAVPRLAAALGYPVLADPLSGVRCGQHSRAYVLDCYDAVLRDERAAALTPDVVLRFGATPTSKALLTFLRGVDRHVLVDGDGGWRDPLALAGEVLHADAALLCAALADEVVSRSAPRALDRCAGDPAWSERWLTSDRRARGAIAAYLEQLGEPFEGKVFAELAEMLPDGATLYAGNSMPVRDLETFFAGSGRDVRFLSNRGANGIDGVVSSALGASAAALTPQPPLPQGARGSSEAPLARAQGEGSGVRAPLVLVIGDLSFYHDLNGLLAVRRYGLDATIVLLNNDGAGIFSFLPQAAYADHFEELFGTPTGLDFRPAVEMYGCGFERVASWPDFRAAVSRSLTSPGVQVIELPTDRACNVELHRRVWAAVAEAVWRD
jgi:2-succinyl-5-enolpyruvyl-6-hydroxy-3-cyclohexene-1-carboxylate synthase